MRLLFLIAISLFHVTSSAEKPPPNILILHGDNIYRDSFRPWGSDANGRRPIGSPTLSSTTMSLQSQTPPQLKSED